MGRQVRETPRSIFVNSEVRSGLTPGTFTDALITNQRLVCCSVFLFHVFSLCYRGGTPLTLLAGRYDARLILDPDLLSAHREGRRSSSPSGWSDIPSDAEDTFFFSQADAEDYRRDKRRRLMESAHEERLRMLALLEPADEPRAKCWASDEEVCGSDTLEPVSNSRISPRNSAYIKTSLIKFKRTLCRGQPDTFNLRPILRSWRCGFLRITGQMTASRS